MSKDSNQIISAGFEILFDVEDNKIRNHCYITEKYRYSAYWSCINNLTLTKKVL